MPGSSKAGPWGAVPIRAAGDPRLSTSHFRVLLAIARHAEFGRNGSGCYATHQTIAAETGLARPTVSTAVGDLVRMGYLIAAPRPGRKRRQYFVVYDELSSAADTSRTRIVSDGVPNDAPALSATHDQMCQRAVTQKIPEGYSSKPADDFIVRGLGEEVDIEATASGLRSTAETRPLSIAEFAWLEVIVEQEIDWPHVLATEALELHARHGGPDYIQACGDE